MTKMLDPSQIPGAAARPLLRLEFGDRLTRAEFERRSEANPQIKKAELIEGVVHVAAAVRHSEHSEPHSALVGLLWAYKVATPGVRSGDNGTVRLDLENVVQPDAYLCIEEAHGGRSRIEEDGCISGPPELVAEIAASSASYDLHSKLHVYRRSGVLEYVVWRVLDKELDWFVLDEGRYDRRLSDADGLIRSSVFPGLWLDRAALLGGNLPQVVASLQKGLASAEHAAFVARMQKS